MAEPIHDSDMASRNIPIIKARRCLQYWGSVCITLIMVYLLLTGPHGRLEHIDSKSAGQPVLETTTERTPRDYVPPNKTFVQMSMRERAAFVRQRCAETTQWKNFTTLVNSKFVSALLIDDTYNLTLCLNRKVASTNIRRVFYTLLNENIVDDINDIAIGAARHVQDFEHIPVGYINASNNIKVTFVRDPLERLLSAYRDNRGFEDLRTHRDLTFKEFLQAIAMKSLKWTNIHMASYFDTCLPCAVDYDYIGMMETFDDDMKFILRKIHADFVKLPKRKKTGYVKSSHDEMAEHLKDVSPRLLDFIWNKYRMDYYMFGYDHPAKWLS